MGREYVIEHCVSALSQERKDRLYQIYVAECLRICTKNTAVTAQCIADGKAEASYMSLSYEEVLASMDRPRDTRTAEKIKADFLKDFGGKEEMDERI